MLAQALQPEHRVGRRRAAGWLRRRVGGRRRRLHPRDAVAERGERRLSVVAQIVQDGEGNLLGEARRAIGAREVALAAPDVPPEKYPELGARYRHHYLARQDAISLFDGVIPMLAELKAQQQLLAVATGKSRKGLDACLAAVELRGLFDASRTADETAGKPHPRMLHELMAELGVEAPRVLMIGDTTHDLQMAVNAGCASVGVSYGAHAPDAFGALEPRFIAHSVPELHAWLIDNA